ncbi:MAG: tripartite tricarboxylate transporter permease [Alphaproteobacteria bacterium]
MEVSMLDAAIQAFFIIMDPSRLGFLCLGVVMGLALGIIPGIGGLVGMALLLPFTFDMDPYAAFAMLLGMSAVTNTSDTIPAVLFGVPGTSGAQATVMDGLPMAKKGEAGRALSAAYTASLLGGLCGAALLALTIPLLRPVMLYIGSPELLGFAIFGISMVAVLSGSAPLRGLAAAGFGLMLSMIGSDPQTGTLRWTMDSLYLWDGLPLVPMVLGLFALPELTDLMIKRTSIAPPDAKVDVRKGMLQGVRDTLRNWGLVMRCGALGAGIGAIPGLGSSVVDWIAYSHALQTVKDADKTFGTGDVRGVIAPESANNSINGGALVPTVAFGVPGSAGMAILLGAFLIHGLVPGPDMLGKNLQVTYSMVWSVAIANILGAGLCFMFSGYFAKLALLRYTLLLPGVLTVVYIGAFQATRQWGDLYALLAFSMLGWTMKHLKWPRPPLILGVVLGSIVERYMFISIERYGADWLLRPVVIVLLALALMSLMGPFLRDVKYHGGLKNMLMGFGAPKLKAEHGFYVFFLVLVGVMLYQASSWNADARIAPMIVGIMAFSAAAISFFYQVFQRVKPVKTSMQEPAPESVAGPERKQKKELQARIHMDLSTDMSDIPRPVFMRRAATFFFGWVLGFLASMAVIGVLPTVAIFVVLFMRLENREPWKLVVPQAVALVAFIYYVFDQLLTIPWPQTFIGEWFPALRVIPTV